MSLTVLPATYRALNKALPKVVLVIDKEEWRVIDTIVIDNDVNIDNLHKLVRELLNVIHKIIEAGEVRVSIANKTKELVIEDNDNYVKVALLEEGMLSN